jgi:hypothetical protein
LGILLYELIHGYSPFRAQNGEEIDDEYSQIFKNIIKYNFKIDKEISKNCADLISSKEFIVNILIILLNKFRTPYTRS